MNMKQNFWLKILVGLSLTFGVATVYYYRAAQVSTNAHESISDYNEQRDIGGVINLFSKDWYWLSARDYSEDRIRQQFREHSPNEYESQFFGKMRIKMLHEGSSLVGFVTYYMKNFYEGRVLFLSIDQNFRGKRYGQQLLEYAVNDLKSMGAKIVTLAVRSANASALKLYTRVGFVPGLPDADGFITCTLSVE